MASLRLQGLQRAARRSLAPNSHRTLFSRASPPPPNPVRTGLYATALVLSTGLFAVYYFDSRSALHRYVLTPILRHAFDAETGHKLAVKVLRSGLGPKDPVPDDEKLEAEIWGRKISNPIGLAAGFDKDGEAVDGLFDLGFSWVEIGSVTPKPQPGNPRPRVFHLAEDEALINRYGFPSQGHASVLSRLRSRIPSFLSTDNSSAALRDGSILAVNLGKNKNSPPDSIEDFLEGVRTFGEYADVLVVNVSSPNTPGLRGLQNRESLEHLLGGVVKARNALPPSTMTLQHPRPRVVLKIAPDLDESQLQEMAEVIRESAIDGVIVSNTTIQRPKGLQSQNAAEQGGLSGAPLKSLTLQTLRTLRSHLPQSIPIIGCGGITSGEDALEYARAGATMVQVYTGFGYDGVGMCRRVKDEIVHSLGKTDESWSSVTTNAIKEKSLSEEEISRRKQREKEVKEKAKALLGTQTDSEEELGEVTKLIKEAEDLKRLLDEFDDGLRKTDIVESAAAAAEPVIQ
ncbi:Dihydroorotate dehydrogenase (quinone), mitochondrial [Marasmius sp. AFHP31]|nr:Dihydroorotate dehydrogenase (quinone), mitochondrial [Marasmius sp. AFHP31]KAK1229214.1 Dihydroorotate dehydrogenase (quinone), mitochondrial [Marasmius sp. AFHP31]